MTSDEMQHDSVEVVEAIDNESLIDEKTGWNRMMVEQIARDIQIANEINPKGWAVVLSDNVPVLNVASNNILSAKPSLTQTYANFAINVSQLTLVERQA